MERGNIYYFNPTCELAVANGSYSYQPPLLLREMEQDLSILPIAFCEPSDHILTDEKPSTTFVNKLSDNGLTIPNFKSLTELEEYPGAGFNWLKPWGWSPAVNYYLKNLKQNCSPEFKSSPVFNWNERQRPLFERDTSLEFLKEIITCRKDDSLIYKELIGRKLFNINEIDELLTQCGQLVLKAPLSSSGRGIQMLRKSHIDNAKKQWISGILKQQGYIIAEPLLEKAFDFSFQYKIISETDIEYIGISVFETGSNGQYIRTLVNADFCTFFNREINQHLLKKVNELALALKDRLKVSKYSALYCGFLGIDAMIFKHNGQYLIQPCVEINCRTNMGILAKSLEKYVHEDCKGKFEIFYDDRGKYSAFSTEKTNAEPVVLKNGKIFSGFLPITEGQPNARFGAYLSVDGPK
jgi:hypothetical protein